VIRQIMRGGRRFVEAGAGTGEAGAAGAEGGSLRRAVPWLDPPPGPWTVERSYAYCEEFVRAHHESYPVASHLV
jgi:hypothetical protein